MDAFDEGRRSGAYWGIGKPLKPYQRPPRLVFPETAYALADVSTRLSSLDLCQQRRLINWGYASCAASLDANFRTLNPEPRWPFPENLP
jgi:hypothetical protein